MIWVAMSHRDIGFLQEVTGLLNGKDYVDIPRESTVTLAHIPRYGYQVGLQDNQIPFSKGLFCVMVEGKTNKMVFK